VAPQITFTELDECFAGAGEGCRTTVTIEFTALDECSDVIVGVELDANYVEANGFNPDNAAALGIGVTLENDGNGNYTVTATNVPVGEHALRVRAANGCGNVDARVIEFCVTADRSPAPICIQTLTVVLMDDGNGGGTAAIWASDFIASPIEDCFGNEITKYSLFRSSVAGAAGFVPSFNPPSTDGIDDIDCADFEVGTVSVRIYALDNNGTTPDYCEVVLEVQDNMGHCDDGGSGNVAGLIADQDDVVLDNATVSLEVRATTTATLSEELTLTDAITVREGVGANGLGLAFNTDLAPATAQPSETAAQRNVLYQNTPNPVRMETVIRFELAAAASVTLTLRDAAGRLISVQEIDAAAGLNTVELTNIRASGVLTYTLTAGAFTASKKMVVVR
jgi:hypothetical protein